MEKFINQYNIFQDINLFLTEKHIIFFKIVLLSRTYNEFKKLYKK